MTARARCIAASALAGAATAATAGGAPTGHPLVDLVIIGAGVGLIALISSYGPWWAPVPLASAAAGLGRTPPLVGVAVAVVAVCLTARSLRRPELVVVATALALNVVLRVQHQVFVGFTAIVASLGVCAIVIASVGHAPPRLRRVVRLGAGGAVCFATLAVVGIGVAAYRASDDLRDSLRFANRGVAALERNRYGEAATWFERAAEDLRSANAELGRPWAGPSRFVPIVAQHRHALIGMSAAGQSAASTLTGALYAVDGATPRLERGRVDLEAFSGLGEPLSRVRQALTELQTAIGESRSPWLLPAIGHELDDVESKITARLPALDDALAVVDLAPQMLGAEGPRTFLLLFTTPAEARGLGGFIGSVAEVSVDRGYVTLSRTWSAARLDRTTLAAGAYVDGPDEFLSRYGRFGYSPGGVGDAAFRNLTMTPHFPWVGQVAARMYEQATGTPIDGVLAIDPFVIAAVLEFTGPIRIDGFDEELSAGNAVDFLLLGQYIVGADDNTARRDALTDAARVTFEALVAGGLPEPLAVIRDLGPYVEDRRLLFWSAHPEERALLERIGMDGVIPELDGGDGWAFTVTNAVGSKIDSFLERRASYESVLTDRGETDGTLRIELTNTAPSDGLPPYIISAENIDRPSGTSRLYVSIYSALGLASVDVDGEVRPVEAGRERGWNVYAFYVDIPPGDSVSITAHLIRRIAEPDRVVTWVQPMANPLEPLPGRGASGSAGAAGER